METETPATFHGSLPGIPIKLKSPGPPVMGHDLETPLRGVGLSKLSSSQGIKSAQQKILSGVIVSYEYLHPCT